jgi:hypothetical protein
MSKYALIVSGDPLTGEHTNIGVIVFDSDGKYFSHRRPSLARAIARGDWQADDPGDWLDNWIRNIESEAKLSLVHESNGHAMSRTRIGSLCGSTLSPANLLDQLFARFFPAPEGKIVNSIPGLTDIRS